MALIDPNQGFAHRIRTRYLPQDSTGLKQFLREMYKKGNILYDSDPVYNKMRALSDDDFKALLGEIKDATPRDSIVARLASNPCATKRALDTKEAGHSAKQQRADKNELDSDASLPSAVQTTPKAPTAEDNSQHLSGAGADGDAPSDEGADAKGKTSPPGSDAPELLKAEKLTKAKAIVDGGKSDVKWDNPKFHDLISLLFSKKIYVMVHKFGVPVMCIYDKERGFSDDDSDLFKYYEAKMKDRICKVLNFVPGVHLEKERTQAIEAVKRLNTASISKLFSTKSGLQDKVLAAQPDHKIQIDTTLTNFNDGVIYLDPTGKLVSAERTKNHRVLWSSRIDVNLKDWLADALSSDKQKQYDELMAMCERTFPSSKPESKDTLEWLLCFIAENGLGRKADSCKGGVLMPGGADRAKSTILKAFISGTGPVGALEPEHFIASKQLGKKCGQAALLCHHAGALFALCNELRNNTQANFTAFQEFASGNGVSVDGRDVPAPVPVVTFNPQKVDVPKPAPAVQKKIFVITDSMMGLAIAGTEKNDDLIKRAQDGEFKGAALRLLFNTLSDKVDTLGTPFDFTLHEPPCMKKARLDWDLESVDTKAERAAEEQKAAAQLQALATKTAPLFGYDPDGKAWLSRVAFFQILRRDASDVFDYVSYGNPKIADKLCNPTSRGFELRRTEDLLHTAFGSHVDMEKIESSSVKDMCQFTGARKNGLGWKHLYATALVKADSAGSHDDAMDGSSSEDDSD